MSAADGSADRSAIDTLFSAAAQRVARGEGEKAYRDLVTVVTAAPFHAAAWYNLGAVLHVGRKWAAAAAAFQRAAAILGDGAANAYHLTNVGWNLHLADRTSEAEVWLRQAIAKDSRVALAHSNLAMVLCAQGRLDEALDEARRGVSLGDTTPAHQMALAFVLFAQGKWAEGLAAFESRIRFKFPEFDAYPMPRWRGQRVHRLFIQAEQGLGDTLWLWRWIAAAAERVDELVIFAQKELRSLLELNRPANVEIQPLPRALPAADAFLPMMSLPVALGLATAQLAATQPAYIGEVSPAARQWPPRRIAVVWAGSAEHDMDRHRSLPFSAMVPLFDLPLKWLSFQCGDRAGEIDKAGCVALVEDLSPRLLSFEDSARELAAVDLVITADTSLAHLAGAMGLPTWVLLGARGVDWRHGQSGDSTHWYPSWRYIRQRSGETWADVILRIRGELKQMMEGTDGRSAAGQ